MCFILYVFILVFYAQMCIICGYLKDEDEGTIDRQFYSNEHRSCPEGAPVSRG